MIENRETIIANMVNLLSKLERNDELKILNAYFELKKNEAFIEGLANSEEATQAEFIKTKSYIEVYDRLIYIGNMVKKEYEQIIRKLNKT